MRSFGRRTILNSLGALLVAPLASRAQQPGKVRRIGFLSLDAADSEAGRQARSVFPVALEPLGYVEHRDLVIEWRWADGKSADLAKLAADLVRREVDLIVARTNAPVQAAMNATRTIPIVMLNGNFPVEAGLVQSLPRPGGNVTGTSYLVSPAIFGKHVQILKELAPRTERIAALRNAGMAGTLVGRAIDAAVKAAAARLGMTVHHFDVRHPEDVGAALQAIAASGIKAMWYRGDPIFRARTDDIMAFLRTHRVAAIGTIPTFAEAGGLAHYAPDVQKYFDSTARYVDRILKGARPAELAVEEPSKYELVINLRTARMLDITVPQSLRLQADKLIE